MTADSTVFIVDDNNSVRDSLRWLVQSVGLNVETYASAQEYLDNYEYDRAGCLLLDVRMPGIGGIEAAKLIRSDSSFGHVRIIATTGNATEYDDIDMASAGFNAILHKPINLDQVKRVIEQGCCQVG